jgi:hypothetical protein
MLDRAGQRLLELRRVSAWIRLSCHHCFPLLSGR